MQRVLIVDDDKAFVDGMEIALRSKERMIYRAYGVQDAIDVLKREKEMKLICSDYEMRDGTFINLMEFIKKQKIRCQAIVISGRDDSKDVVKMKKVGAREIFDKGSFNIQEIKMSVTNILKSLG